jgi:hypothetical protein
MIRPGEAHPRPDLREDERGTLLITGLMMGCGLITVCWYMLETWRDVMQREGVQVAADAVAAGGAAWYAAGMNILAFINVAMALMLAVFVAVRAAELLGVATFIVAAALSFVFPGAAVVANAGMKLSEFAFKLENKMQKPWMRALNLATTSERAVAVAFPYLSVAASTVSAYTLGAQDSTGGGAAGTLALAPTVLDEALAGELKRAPGKPLGVTAKGATDKRPVVPVVPERMGRLGEGGRGILEKVKSKIPNSKVASLVNVGNLAGSMPVEAEEYAQVCSRAAERLSSLLHLIPGLSAIDGFVDKAAAFLGGNLPSLVCQPVSEAASSIEANMEAEADKEADGALEKRADELALAACPKETQGDVRLREAKRNKCIADTRPGKLAELRNSPKGDKVKRDAKRDAMKRNQAKVDELKKSGKDLQASVDTIKTARLWTPIGEEGACKKADKELEASVLLHVWSVYEDVDVSSKRFNIPIIYPHGVPTRGLPSSANVPVPSIEANTSSAKARIYFEDPGSAPNVLLGRGDPSIHSCADNSMWTPGNWKWKMVVDRTGFKDLALSGQQALSALLGNAVGRGVQVLLQSKLGGRLQWTRRIDGRNYQADTSTGGRAGDMHLPSWWIADAVDAVVDGDPANAIPSAFLEIR